MRRCIEDVENLLTGASHNVHIENNVFGVRDFDTVLGNRGTERKTFSGIHRHPYCSNMFLDHISPCNRPAYLFPEYGWRRKPYSLYFLM